MSNINRKNPLSFFKWMLISVVVFVLSLSLWLVVMNQEAISKFDYLKIPLLNDAEAYYLKGEINNLEMTFVLDTGANESMISEKEFLRVTRYKSSNIEKLERRDYILADGSTVYCERISVREMKIGNYTINNVVFGIMPNDVDNLLGKNVLDKFQKWSIDKNLNELTFVKELNSPELESKQTVKQKTNHEVAPLSKGISKPLIQTVEYKSVKFNLPKGWIFNSEEDYRNGIEVSLISFSEKESSALGFFQILNKKITPIENINLLKESIDFENVKYTENKNEKIGKIEGVICKLDLSIMDESWKGVFFTFNQNSRSYSLVYIDVLDSYDEKFFKNIISSISFLDEENNIQPKSQNVWTTYNINSSVTIDVPSTMELRDEKSLVAQVKKVYTDTFETSRGIKINNPNVVFQPKGMNELEEGQLLYARILVTHIKGQFGDFSNSDDRLTLTISEQYEENISTKKEYKKELDEIGNKLIRFFPVEISSMNNLFYKKVSYIRKKDSSPNVKVNMYTFYNNHEAYIITLSHRVSESSLWEKDFEQVINSFRFK